MPPNVVFAQLILRAVSFLLSFYKPETGNKSEDEDSGKVTWQSVGGNNFSGSTSIIGTFTE